MRVWKDQSPFLLADPFDNAGHVALHVAAILEGAALVAEMERAPEHHPLTDLGAEKPYRALRARKLGGAHQAVPVSDAAIEPWVDEEITPRTPMAHDLQRAGEREDGGK